MSTTQNVKGKGVAVASYTTEAVFKIPDGLDLEDKTVVEDWRTKYGKLYISYVNSEEVLEIDSVWDTDIDYKYSSDEVIADADEFNVEYEQDDERKCRDCDYTWTTEDFDAGKGRVAFSHPCEGIKEGDVVCTMCHVKGFECHKCKTWIQRDSEAHGNSIVKHDDTNPLVDNIFCQNCEPKCESDSESDDGEDKEYRITDIEFDIGSYCEEALLEEFDVEDGDELHKSLIEDTIGKTWFACDEEQLCDNISDETGWYINSFSCERVCTSTIKPTDSNTEDEEDECPLCKGEKCNLSHLPYFCDNGCGKIVGCGVDDECVRTCSCDYCKQDQEVKENKFEVRVLRTICTACDDSDNTDDEGLQIVSSKTFSDIDEARLYFNDNVKSCKLLQEDHEIHVEFDDITHEFDPEMIERWSINDKLV